MNALILCVLLGGVGEPEEPLAAELTPVPQEVPADPATGDVAELQQQLAQTQARVEALEE